MRRTRHFATFALAVLTALTLWANHPWPTRVYEYRPAPGQFINTMPVCRVGEPVDSVLARCQSRICGRIDTVRQIVHGQEVITLDTLWRKNGMISLGGYGGYVTIGFDHPVVNMHTWDFEIWGNAFVSDLDSRGGSSEPGIVVVGVDADGDGVPSDGDKWYELAGSEYYHPKTQHGFTITYYRPDESKPYTPSTQDSHLIDSSYIYWTSNDIIPDSTSGYISRNDYHFQPYWPLWLQDEETITFSGTKLRCNGLNISEDPHHPYFVEYFFDWGYVDNLPNLGEDTIHGLHSNGFKIDWAVDEEGNHVNLDYVDFIKVYTGVNQYCGWLGEISTEITGAIDFHPDAVLPQVLPGDVNEDGIVNISDVNVLIAIILAGTSGFPAADVNGDGSVNIADVNAVISKILQ